MLLLLSNEAAGAGSGNASGSLPGVVVSALDGSASDTGAGVGAMSSVTVTTADASAVGRATASGAIPGVVAVVAAGTASGMAAAAGGGVTASASAPSAAATGAASAAGVLEFVLVGTLDGAASLVESVPGEAVGALPSVAVSAPSGSATGSSVPIGSGYAPSARPWRRPGSVSVPMPRVFVQCLDGVAYAPPARVDPALSARRAELYAMRATRRRAA
jgi:hypothetical protein